MSDVESGSESQTNARPPASSEVGCHSRSPRGKTSRSEDDKWCLLLEHQNRNFMALMQAMKGQPVNQELRLPEFDPDNGLVDARAWISTADMCVLDQQLTGAPLMLALSTALKGQASAWLAQISYHGMCWSDFKELFVSRYDCSETAAAHLINLHGSKPKEGECLAAYAATLMTSLMSKWKDLSVEQIAVSTVISHIAQFEPRVQRMSFTHDISNRNRLQQELKAVSFLKRKTSMSTADSAGDVKRSRESSIKCYNCNELGHKASQCRHRCEFSRQTSRASTPSSEGQRATISSKDMLPKMPLTCFHCRGLGHYASECPNRRGREGTSSGSIDSVGSSQPGVKRVDSCTISAPTGSTTLWFDEKESISGVQQLKSSVQKGIRARLLELYPHLENYIDQVLPKKDTFRIVKCHDHIEIMVNSAGELLFFRHREGPWMPTLRLLHKYPFFVPMQQVDKGAIRFVLSGANIMCPGLTSPGAKMTPIEKGHVVAVMAEGKEHALAVGMTALSTDDIAKVNKGVGIENCHYLNDGLWQMKPVK